MHSLAIIRGADKLEQDIALLGETNPEQAYLISHQLSKIGENGKKLYKDSFKSYYDTNKELPGGFECKISNRKSYKFEENSRWRFLKQELEYMEDQIKRATDSGIAFMDESYGEEVKPVFVGQSEVYSVSRK